MPYLPGPLQTRILIARGRKRHRFHEQVLEVLAGGKLDVLDAARQPLRLPARITREQTHLRPHHRGVADGADALQCELRDEPDRACVPDVEVAAESSRQVELRDLVGRYPHLGPEGLDPGKDHPLRELKLAHVALREPEALAVAA